ncbi:MAG: GAF domain-containing protein [Candidatus Eremiobacteraeota bacterium]|nr:GAF domain-containing protein [Candidatus Eremiobacteraeota bacterium]
MGISPNMKDVSVTNETTQKWQGIVNILAEFIHVPAALIMKVEPPYIEVFRSSESDGNSYEVGDREHLTGLYCERVIKTKSRLLVPNALEDKDWNKNPDIKLGMFSYLGFPLLWPNGEVFGTICVLDSKENHYNKAYEDLILQFKELVESHLKLLYEKGKYEKKLIERKNIEEELKRIEWLISPKPIREKSYESPYGNLTKLNTSRLILDSVGENTLINIVGDCLDLLKTSAAIYEKNGDYAAGVFSSGWCQFLDNASRNLCGTEDNREALGCGKWLCHESCWTEASRASIATGQPVDIECNGGIHIYSVPVKVGKEVVGAINFGYGDPPRDPRKLQDIAGKYKVDVDALLEQARKYQSRPQFIIEIAKSRLVSSARLMGEIVERKRAEEEIANLAKFPAENPNPVLRISGDGIILYHNKRSACLLDAWQWRDKQPIPSQWRQIILETLNTGQPQQSEIECCDRIFSLTYAPVVDSNYVNVYALDITERKRAEDALKDAIKQLDSFSYSVSHDLQAPLRVIDGFSKLLLKDHLDKLDDKGKKIVKTIRQNTQNMSQLITDLLSFSHVGRKEINRQNINMNAIAKKVFKTLKAAVPDRKLQLEIKPLPPASGDIAMIQQVFVNLISNAIKFTRPMETAVIEVGGKKEGNENLYYIKDNGVGFDARYIKNLFKVFQRLHTMEEFEGTGIGLAIVSQIVGRHGGRVWAEGKENGGACFYFTLPRQAHILQ